MRIIYESDDKIWRIIEHIDTDYMMENLKGDVFNPEVNTDIDVTKLRVEELQFEKFVNREGVFGYVLEHWNAEVGIGYEHVDSCWGFVGAYTPNEEVFNHYIVNELKQQTK